MSFDPEKYKIYTWKNWMVLHWILNPAMAINELILGQRVPEISLTDKTSRKPRYERSFVPCPHCGKIHDARTWSTVNNTAFKNWFGLYCNNCGNIIPCVLNLSSLLLLAATAPLWFWFRKSIKANWLKAQPKRYENLEFGSVSNPYENLGWVKIGLNWGLFMFVFMHLILPWIDHSEISWKSMLVGIPVWTLGGLGFGYSMKRFFGGKAPQPSTGRRVP